MKNLKDIPAHIETLIEADATFTTLSVLVNAGQSEAAIEDALGGGGKGVSIEVMPVTKIDRVSQGGTTLLGVAEIVVRVKVNVTRNAAAGGAGANIYDLVKGVIRAVLAYNSTVDLKPDDRYALPGEDVVSLVQFDPGLWVYEVAFQKKIIIP